MIPIVFDDDGDDVTIPDTIELGFLVWEKRMCQEINGHFDS